MDYMLNSENHNNTKFERSVWLCKVAENILSSRYGRTLVAPFKPVHHIVGGYWMVEDANGKIVAWETSKSLAIDYAKALNEFKKS